MLKRRSVLIISAAVALAAAVKIASGQAGATAAQPKVEARVAPLLKINNLTFRDLNRNGSLAQVRHRAIKFRDFWPHIASKSRVCNSGFQKSQCSADPLEGSPRW